VFQIRKCSSSRCVPEPLQRPLLNASCRWTSLTKSDPSWRLRLLHCLVPVSITCRTLMGEATTAMAEPSVRCLHTTGS
jgi:hypothetical protein